MSGDIRNRQVASALFRAGLLDEATLRRVLAEAGGRDLAQLVVSSGLASAEAVTRVLGAGPASGSPVSGRFQATRADRSSPDATVLMGSTPGPGAAPGSSQSLGALVASALKAGPGSELPPGARLGNYTLRKLLARGGMGAVFVAQDEALGRTVALKVLLAGEGAGPEELARFQTEARAAGKLSHPNVVPVYEVGEAQGLSYLCMELVNGPSLKSRIKAEGPLEPRRALAILEQVARGVAAAHAQGIVHRDLKPDNVLLAPGDVAKVMDFGLAKDQAQEGLTVSGAILGTPAYMAPEQAGGERVGPAADVYGLGAILYESLTGKPPFEGATLASLIAAVLTKDPVPPRTLRPALSIDVETICQKALEKEPAKRYESALALAEDAARWLSGEAIRARPLGRRERLGRWVRRHRAPVLVGAVGSLAVLSLGGWFLGLEPLLARRRASEAAREAERRARDEASRFDDAVSAARARVAALASSVSPERASLDAALAAPASEETRLEAAARELSPEARPRVQSSAPWVEATGARAAAWLAHGRALDGAGSHEGAAAAFAEAYAQAPLVPAGREALAELALRRDGAGESAAADHLLAPCEPALAVSPAARARLRLARAERLLGSLDVEGAGRELDLVRADPAAASAAAAGLARLETFVEPLRAAQLWEPGPDEPRVLGARVVPGAKPSLALVQEGGAATILEWDAASRALVPVARLEAPRLHPGEGVRLAAAGRAPLRGAVFTTENRLVVSDEHGTVLGACARSSTSPVQLDFMDLGAPAGTSDVVLLLGPNEGDSLHASVDAGGHVTFRELDPSGRHGGRGAQCYAWAACAATVRGEPRLLVAYASWYALHVRTLARTANGLDLVGTSAVVGTIRASGGNHALIALDVDGDGTPEIVAAHRLGEEPRAAGVTPPGIAVYALEPAGIRTPSLRHVPALDRPIPSEDSWVRGIQTFEAFRLAGKVPVAVHSYEPQPPPGAPPPREGDPDAGRLRVVRLDGREPRTLVDATLARGLPAVLASGDLAGTGEGALVLAHGRGVRVLGLGARPRAAALAPAAAVDAETARSVTADLLDRLGFHRRALQVYRDREQRSGITAETERGAVAELGRLAKLDDLLAESESFLAHPGRTAESVARVRLLRARRLADVGDPESAARAAGDASAARQASPDLDGPTLAEIDRIVRLAEARSTGAPALELDFARLDPAHPDAALAEHLLATDPVRTRLVPEGLEARVNRRVRLIAGVPVTVPSGVVRVELDFSFDGRTRDARPGFGLVREGRSDVLDGGGAPGFEGLYFHLHLWSTGSAFTTGLALGPVFGRPVEWEPARQGPFEKGFALPWPFVYRARLKAVLEHDTRTRWSRFRLSEAGTGTVVADAAGPSETALVPGAYVAGFFAPGGIGDYAGSGLASDARVRVERVRIACSNASRRAPVIAAGPPSPALAVAAAGGRAVTASAARLEGAVAAFEPVVVAAGPAGARLLLQRASVRARSGDGAGARADLERAWRTSPFETFRGLEDDGQALDGATARLVREVLGDATGEARGALARDAHDLAAAIRFAAAQILRGEPAEALATLDAVEPAGAAPSLATAYLRTSGNVARRSALDGLLPQDAATPEMEHFLRRFWLPEPPAGNVETLLASKVKAATTPDEQRLWLDRWLELAPDRVDVRRIRARLLLGSAQQDARWLALALADLEAIVAASPDDAQSLATLALHEALSLGDRASALRHFRAARAAGADVKALLEDPKIRAAGASQEGWDAFHDSVLR